MTPYLLVHGSADRASVWRALRAELPADQPVVTLPGSVSLPALEAAAREIAGPFVLVGHSYGGLVALSFALSNEDRILAMALVEPVAFDLLRSGNPEAWERLHSTLNLAGSNEEAVRRMIEFWFGAKAWTGAPEKLRNKMLAASDEIRAQLLEASTLELSEQALRKLRVPTALLAGSRTNPLEHRVLDCLEDLLPCCSRRLVEGAGHDSVRTHPQEVISAVASLLDQAGHPR